MKFDIVWEDFIQEEARVANREALLKEDDQALATHTKRKKQSNFKKDSHKEYRPPKKFQRKRENNHKIRHLSRECPLKKKNNKIHHAHLAKDDEEE